MDWFYVAENIEAGKNGSA